MITKKILKKWKKTLNELITRYETFQENPPLVPTSRAEIRSAFYTVTGFGDVGTCILCTTAIKIREKEKANDVDFCLFCPYSFISNVVIVSLKDNKFSFCHDDDNILETTSYENLEDAETLELYNDAIDDRIYFIKKVLKIIDHIEILIFSNYKNLLMRETNE